MVDLDSDSLSEDPLIMDPIFDKPIFVYMRCTYKQAWPGLTRVHLETDRLRTQWDGSISRDGNNLELEFSDSDNEQPDINIGDEFKVTLKKLT